jgi:hypothetical protein
LTWTTAANKASAIPWSQLWRSAIEVRKESKAGNLTPQEEKQQINDLWEEYRKEQKAKGTPIVGCTTLSGQYPTTFLAPGALCQLQFQFIDTNTGLPIRGPEVAFVLYQASPDPNSPNELHWVGMSADPRTNFAFRVPVNGFEPSYLATPYDRTGKPIVIRGLDNENVAVAFSTVLFDTEPAITPLSLQGYNADVIVDQNPSVRFAQPFDANTFAWFERGAVDDNGAPHLDGLPAGLTFTSVTGSGATYQLQPAYGPNVLQLGPGQTGTLWLTVPEPSHTLYIIGSSGNGTPTSTGNGIINFADGTLQTFNVNVFDWFNGSGNLHLEAALPGPNGRANVGPFGTAFSYVREGDFQLYETIIPIDPVHAGIPILNIDFLGAPDAFYSNIFGVSGQ